MAWFLLAVFVMSPVALGCYLVSLVRGPGRRRALAEREADTRRGAQLAMEDETWPRPTTRVPFPYDELQRQMQDLPPLRAARPMPRSPARPPKRRRRGPGH